MVFFQDVVLFLTWKLLNNLHIILKIPFIFFILMRVAIITWASSWLWREFISPLYRTSVDQIRLLARSWDKLKEICAEYWERVIPYVIDLSKKEEINLFIESLKATWAEVMYLVNNAGFWTFGSFEGVDVENSLRMVDVNIKAMVDLIGWCLPYMGKDSHIINVSSMASFQPVPYMSVYAWTKAFIKNYSRALNIELKDKYITVTAVCPWWMKTWFMDVANVGAKKTPKKYVHLANPEYVAEKALRDAEKWKDISVYWWYPKMIRFFSFIVPDKILMKSWLRQQDL